MSESLQHQILVQMIIDEIISMIGEENSCLIEADVSCNRPLPQFTIEGFRPDVLYQYCDMLILGEAKTSKDVEREHSLMQYESYIRKCSLFIGKAILLIAVPWEDYATVYNITQKIRKKYPGTYTIKIISRIDAL